MCVKTNVDTLYSHMCTSTSEQMCVPMLFSEHGGIPAHANMPKKFDDAGPTFSIYTWAATIELSGPGEGHCKVPFPSAWCPSPNPTMDKNANTRSVCICMCHTKSNLHFKQISHLIKDVDMSHGSLESPPVTEIQRSANRKTYWNSACIFWTLSDPGQVDYSGQPALTLQHNFICLHVAHPRVAVSKLLHIKSSTATCNTLQFSLFKIWHMGCLLSPWWQWMPHRKARFPEIQSWGHPGMSI